MKVIVAGSRGITQQEIVDEAIKESGFTITAVLCGEARGVDTCGRVWAARNNVDILSYPANWREYGRRAGLLRNTQMVKEADALIAVWDGESHGTAHVIREARRKGIPVHIHLVKGS